MLELPESYTIGQQITRYLKGKCIERIEIGHTPHKFAFFKGEVEKYHQMLVGEPIEKATNQGGLVEIQTDKSMIFFGDGAYPRYYDGNEKLPDKHQFMLYFQDGTAIGVSIQMYGEIGIFPIGACEDGYFLSSSSKPSPLSEAFSYEYFRELYQPTNKKMTIKAFLATEQRIPGLGNGVLQDILWNAGFDPRYDMKNMQEKDFELLYKIVKEILSDMCAARGRDTEKDLLGNKGGYITKLSKNTVGQLCPRCEMEIQKANYMGGTVYFCEQCQRR